MGEEDNYGFSSEWTVSEERPGYMVKIVSIENVNGRIFRPILTPAERTKREDDIMTGLARIMAPYL